VRALLKCGATLPDEILKAEEMKDVVREVERERLSELMRGGETGKAQPALQAAERDFEGARQRMLKLAIENCRQRTAPAIHVYETQLAETRAATKMALESEEKLQVQVDAMNSTLAKIEKETALKEKDLQKVKDETDKVKAAYLKKMKQVSEMKKEASEARANAKKLAIRTETLIASLSDALAKLETLQGQLEMFEKEGDACEEQLNGVREKLAVWHERKREALLLHQKAQELLNRDRTSPRPSPRTR